MQTRLIKRFSHKRNVLLIVVPFFLIFSLYFCYLHIQIRQASNQVVPENADYMIILGAKVKGTIPSLSLQYRIDAAADYLQANPKTIAIASGGQGPGEDMTEAEAIKRELMKKGISETRILVENQSTSTNENIRFSKRMIPEEMVDGLVVSNDYHIFRATKIGKDHGLMLIGIPAKTPTVALLKSYSREYLALTKYYLMQITSSF